ncbi:hypothetical protein ACLOJK_035722 [Asimina triloba]
MRVLGQHMLDLREGLDCVLGQIQFIWERMGPRARESMLGVGDHLLGFSIPLSEWMQQPGDQLVSFEHLSDVDPASKRSAATSWRPPARFSSPVIRANVATGSSAREVHASV